MQRAMAADGLSDVCDSFSQSGSSFSVAAHVRIGWPLRHCARLLTNQPGGTSLKAASTLPVTGRDLLPSYNLGCWFREFVPQ